MVQRALIRLGFQTLSLWMLLGLLLASAAAVEQDKTPSPSETQNREADAGSKYISLDSLVAQMLSNNPDLQAARKRWEAAQKRPAQEHALPDPTLRLGWAGAGAPYPGAGLGTESAANIGIEISQLFPFPGKRALKGSIANQAARAESFSFQGTERNLVSRLKASFYELQFIYGALDILTRDKILLERLAKVVENRYSVGEATQQDLIKSQVEISVLEIRKLEFERRKQSAGAEINSLLNREMDVPLGRPQPPGDIPALPSFESMQSSAMVASPALRAQRATIDGRRLSLDLSRREYYPDFEVMGGYFNMGSMKDMYEFRVQMNIPIFFGHKQRLGVEEAGVRLGESQKEYRAQERMLSLRIKDQHLTAENSRRLMDLYSKLIIPQASLALESSLASYGTGKVDFLSVLSNFSTILENEINYCENRTRYLQALANLQELAGQE
jgi:outer membrane protein, heavy metal efflux system